MRVLLAEDDEHLSSALVLALRHREYTVDTVKSGPEAQAAALSVPYNLILLDLGLPGLDGLQILEDIRREGNTVPVIVITARDGVDDRIRGLDLGANDYLVKPFDFRELEARMRAALRKSEWRNKIEIELGSIKLNTNCGTLYLRDQQMDLTPKETIVLKTLMSQSGRVVSKRYMLRHMSDWLDEPTENAVEIIVHRLRRKLESSDVAINTVRGFGYLIEVQKP